MKNTDLYYEKSTGRILYSVAGSPGTRNTVDSSVGWISGATADDETQWVDDGEIKDRPELDLPDHIVVNLSDNEVELPDIPEDTVVRYDGMEAGVADEEGITLSFDEVGKWEIYFDPPFPYQPAIIEAEVEDD